ncbi:ATP-grasp domain-containing protein [Methanolobus halotolerans]|uniref:ATP-dependent carboligase n=1 Tax=Methanolobus halotolerans TaxID=2052935 RepID=A0A4E0PTQ3_9EURY|nr:ATP-grasp domain-containing protein [Methanolobus halotolerans]TGC07918.1 ATP-dependent carboligase [Methanolobus halotolerans]
MKNILVIGFSTRNIVCSGKRAGYNMFAIDAFCDHDMLECAKATIKLHTGESFDARNIEPCSLTEQIESFGTEFDAIIPASGFETMEFPGSLPVLRNDHDSMEQVSDKSRFAKLLRSLDLPHPQTYALSELESITYPVMIKPACAGGGIFNRVLYSQNDLQPYLESLDKLHISLKKEDMIVQDYLIGTPASVSVISTEDEARTVAINEQLIGTPWLTKVPFAYCGNVTPFITPYADQMKNIAEELIKELGLIGSNGVDFLMTRDGPVIIEVNARFQGSLDTVEMSTGSNIFEAHMQAFEGNIRLKEPSKRQYAARAILYGNRDKEITSNIQRKILERYIADVPKTGDMMHIDEPLTSVLSTGRSRGEVISEAKSSVMFIRECLEVDTSRRGSPRTESTYV